MPARKIGDPIEIDGKTYVLGSALTSIPPGEAFKIEMKLPEDLRLVPVPERLVRMVLSEEDFKTIIEALDARAHRGVYGEGNTPKFADLKERLVRG